MERTNYTALNTMGGTNLYMPWNVMLVNALPNDDYAGALSQLKRVSLKMT